MREAPPPGHRSQREPLKRSRSLAVAGLSVALLLAGLICGYVRWELAEPRPFADKALNALESEEVRAAIAEQIAVGVLEQRSPDLVALRPLVLTGIEAILETAQFQRLLRRAAATAHAALLQGDRDVAVDLAESRDLIALAVEKVAPELSTRLPADIAPRIAEIRETEAAARFLRTVNGLSMAALPLLLLGGAGLLGAVAGARDRRQALFDIGVIAAGAGALCLGGLALLRAELLPQAGELGVLSESDARAAAAAVWDALAGGLERWLQGFVVIGVAAAAGASFALKGFDRAAALRRAAEAVAGGTGARPVRVLRAALLALAGTLILFGGGSAAEVAAAVAGLALLVLAFAEVVSLLGPQPHKPQRSRSGSRRRALAVGVIFAVLVACAVIIAGRDGSAPPALAPEEIGSCNGSADLCDRRLDEVVFAGTHNSMSAANRPGWFFANQIEPIPRQLEDGIRLLMIDPHYGVVDSDGRVRTDLRREGTNRNRVARELGPDAVDAAERFVGRLGLVPVDGEPDIFLCHSLCELGAEKMSSALGDIRGFLERNPSEVVILMTESSVDAGEVEEEFLDADLEPYLATLARDEPLPTLREMVASGRRLVVFDEDDGGDEPWYQPAFLFIQDTRIDTLTTTDRTCVAGRGAPENPLFVMNHWLDQFPPPSPENRSVASRDVILERAEECRRALGRLPNAVATDFYDRGDVITAVRALNRRR